MPDLPDNLYTILSAIEDSDTLVESARESLKAAELRRAKLRSAAATALRGQPAHAVARGRGNSLWQLVDDEVVMVPVVNGMMLPVTVPGETTPVATKPTAETGHIAIVGVRVPLIAPYAGAGTDDTKPLAKVGDPDHSPGCHCTRCHALTVRAEMSPFVDRPKVSSVV